MNNNVLSLLFLRTWDVHLCCTGKTRIHRNGPGALTGVPAYTPSFLIGCLLSTRKWPTCSKIAVTSPFGQLWYHWNQTLVALFHACTNPTPKQPKKTAACNVCMLCNTVFISTVGLQLAYIQQYNHNFLKINTKRVLVAVQTKNASKCCQQGSNLRGLTSSWS